MAIELDSASLTEDTPVERPAPKEPTWFPDSMTSPEDCRRWLDENHDWAFADEPGSSEEDDEDYC